MNIPMHMPNIPLYELGLTDGSAYYVRITYEGGSYNSCLVGGQYTIDMNLSPASDTYLNGESLSLTTEPNFNWLSGETNLRSGQSLTTDPENGDLSW